MNRKRTYQCAYYPCWAVTWTFNQHTWYLSHYVIKALCLLTRVSKKLKGVWTQRSHTLPHIRYIKGEVERRERKRGDNWNCMYWESVCVLACVTLCVRECLRACLHTCMRVCEYCNLFTAWRRAPRAPICQRLLCAIPQNCNETFSTCSLV